MRGAVTSDVVSPILNGQEFKSTLREFFLAYLISDGEGARVQVAGESIRKLVEIGIGGSAGTEDATHFATCLRGALADACKSTVDSLRLANPQILADLQQGALLKRAVDILENIEQHHDRIDSRISRDSVERDSWILKYRQLCQRHHGFIVPPDFETSRKIPMSELYVVPRLTSYAKNRRGDDSQVDVDAFQRQVDRTVLLGDPGGGKSTLSNYLTSTWAADPSAPVPFHITLREFANRKTATGLSIADYIAEVLSGRFQHAAPDGLIDDLLVSGGAVVVLDGLDELIDTSIRREISGVVELFAEKYPLCGLFVTSRRVGYEQARLDPDTFGVTTMAEFSDEDVSEYVRKWFACQEDYEDEEASTLADSFTAQSEAVPDLRSNPLMLALMCIIFRGENFIPRSRPIVYEKCANLLFEKWDGHRNIEVPLEARAHVDAAMKFIAYWMMDGGNGDAGVSYHELVRVMATYLQDRAAESEEEAERSAKQFVDFCKGRAWVFSDAGTTAEGEALFTFTHRTFMEYFAAYHLTRTSDTPEKLALRLLPKVAAEEWDVVAQLAVQIADKASDRGSERVLRRMLEEPRRRARLGRSNVITFIARCTAFSTVSPTFIRDLMRASIAFAQPLRRNGFLRRSSPTHVLILSVPESLRDPAGDELASSLTTLLRCSDSAERQRGIEVLAELTDLMLERVLHGVERSDWWLLKIFGVARCLSPSDYEEDERKADLVMPLLLSGVIDAETAVRFRSARGRADFEAFYAVSSGLPYVSLSSTLAGVVAGRLLTSTYDLSSLAAVDPLVDIFLAAFWEARSNGDSTVEVPIPVLLFSPSIGEDILGEAQAPGNDVRLLVAMAQAEIVGSHFGHPELLGEDVGTRSLFGVRYGQVGSLESLDFKAFSEPMANFCRAWLRKEVSVFKERPGGDVMSRRGRRRPRRAVVPAS